MKILIVDDSQTMRKIFSVAVSNIDTNIIIYEATNGQEALEILKLNSDIEYIFLDTLMPVMSGYEVLKTIRMDDDLQHHKVIIQTAQHKHEELMSLIDIGISGYIVKPYDVSMIEKTIKRWLL